MAVPTGRLEPAYCLDTDRNIIVMYGGFNGAFLGDTWEFDIFTYTWTSMTPTVVGGSLTARWGVRIFYDPARHKIVIYGGYDGDGRGNFIDEVWEYTNTGNNPTWTLATPIVGRPGTLTAVNTQPGFDWNPNELAATYYGGRIWSAPDSNATWRFSGTAWTSRLAGPNPSTGSNAHLWRFDATRNKFVYFGGVDHGSLALPAKTYEYDPVANTWTDRSPAGTVGTVCPVWSGYGSSAPMNGRVFWMGFLTATGQGLSSLTSAGPFVQWEWDGTAGTWTKNVTATKPTTNLLRASCIYIPATNRLLLFGGQDTTSAYHNETWEYDGANWTQTTEQPGNTPITVYMTGAISPNHGDVDGGTLVTATRPTEAPFDPTTCADTLSPYINARWITSAGVTSDANGTKLATTLVQEPTLRLINKRSVGSYSVSLLSAIVQGSLPALDIVLGSFGIYVSATTYARIEVYTNANAGISARMVYALGGQISTSQSLPVGKLPINLQILRSGSYIRMAVGSAIFPVVPGWTTATGQAELRAFTQGTPAPTVTATFGQYRDDPLVISGSNIIGRLYGDISPSALQFIMSDGVLATNVPFTIHTHAFECMIPGGWLYDTDESLILINDGKQTLTLMDDDILGEG